MNRKAVSFTLFAVILVLMSCSEEKTEAPDPVQQDTAAVASDTKDNNQTIRMVVGGEHARGPESLLTIDPRTYSDWKEVACENVRLLCPQNHAHLTSVDGLARAMHRGLNNACRFLAMDVPTNTITVLYYTGPGQGKEMTGMNYSFALGDTLHHWPPNNLGLPIMKYLIPMWQGGESRHDFIRHGLITLLDGSGKNYHKWALTSHQNGSLVPLSQLAVDTTIDCTSMGQGAAWSASFVDFVVFGYGIETLAKLYRSENDFASASEEVFGITVDSLEAQWVNTLEQAVKILEESGK